MSQQRSNDELIVLANELLRWQKTGLLQGDALRSIAEFDVRCKSASLPLSVAEHIVTVDIINAFVALAGENKRLRGIFLSPSEEDLTIVARSIGRTVRVENHYERARDVFRSLSERDFTLPVSPSRTENKK